MPVLFSSHKWAMEASAPWPLKGSSLFVLPCWHLATESAYYHDFVFPPLFPLQGKEHNKPEVSALYIQNPFEQNLNISKNVNATQLERFVNLARESAWLLQQESKAHSSQLWGLAALLHTSKASNTSKGTKRKKGPASERIRGLLDSLKLNNANNGKRSFGTWVW